MEYKIAVVKGDGIGPEIIKEALKVLNSISDIYGYKFKIEYVVGAGEAVDKYGDPLPEKSLKVCKESDAIIIGNLGGRKWENIELDKKPVKAILKLREELKVSTNLRPIVLNKSLLELSPLKEDIIKNGIDILVVRDIAGGMLCAPKNYGTGEYGREASDLEYYNEDIIKKSANIAFKSAITRKNKVASIDKSNVLASSKLWKDIINEKSEEYPDVKVTHHLVDSAAMEVITNPSKFDVIVTSNMFGDILADELSQITGAATMLGSAEIDDKGKGIFTPNQLHYPDESIIGKDKANPIGMIMSLALMLRYSFNLEKEASLIEKSVDKVIELGYVTTDLYIDGKSVVGTEKMGDLIVEYIYKLSLK